MIISICQELDIFKRERKNIQGVCMKEESFNFGEGLQAACNALPDYNSSRNPDDYMYI